MTTGNPKTCDWCGDRFYPGMLKRKYANGSLLFCCGEHQKSFMEAEKGDFQEQKLRMPKYSKPKRFTRPPTTGGIISNGIEYTEAWK